MMTLVRRNRRKGADSHAGQAMVEFALALPLLLLIVVGLLEFGRLLFAWLVVENSTRFGIRYATAGTYNDIYCPSAPASDGTSDCAGASRDEEIDYARMHSIE